MDPADRELFQQWERLEKHIRHWWDDDLVTATEEDIQRDEDKTLLFLPNPYIPRGGDPWYFRHSYAWLTSIMCLALLQHGRYELVRGQLRNQLFLIRRYGMVLNGNATFYTTRSHPPMHPVAIWTYYEQTAERYLLWDAYPLLVHEWEHYWNADHHQTPTGLSTCRDLGDLSLTPERASEAECTNFTAIFEGDIRQCCPLLINSLLVEYARVVGRIAEVCGDAQGQERWAQRARERAELINQYCWDAEAACYREYHYRRGEQLPYNAITRFWPLWARAADGDRAAAVAASLPTFLHEWGATETDQLHPSPFPQHQYPDWSYPIGKTQTQVMLVDGLDRAGYPDLARDVARRYLRLLLRIYQETGKLYEVYDVVDGNADPINDRMHPNAVHGVTAAAVVLLGNRLFADRPLSNPA